METFPAAPCRQGLGNVAPALNVFEAMHRRDSKLALQLEAGHEKSEFRRLLAARLDMSLKRSKVSSSRVASLLHVAQNDVLLWRAGVTVPNSAQCHELAAMLNVDVGWLSGCDGANS
jgi:hypothetical protein